MPLQIPVTLESKLKLIKSWGPEVILKCDCGEIPSHSMWGQYPVAKCPVCKQMCQITVQDWGIVTDGS
jgi:hypothetical protein